MRIFKLLTLLVVVNFSFVVNAQTKTFEIIPEFPKPGEQVTISYNSTNTNLKDATEITGLMYIYDDFRWIIKDITLNKTKAGNWETREQLTNHASLINCVFNSGSKIDNGGKLTYTWMLQDEPGGCLAWGILRNANFKDQVPVKVDEASFIQDSVALMWVKNELKYFPKSRTKVFYEGLLLSKKVNNLGFDDRCKKELRYVLTNKLNNREQYSVQKALQLLDVTTQKSFIDSVQNALLKSYPNGVLARDLELKKIFFQSNIDLKSKLFFDYVKKYPKANYEDVYTDIENLYADKIYKSIAYNAVLKNKDYSLVLNSLKEVSYTNLLDFSWHLISIPFDRDQAGIEKASLETLKMYVDAIIPELEIRETVVPKEYKGMLSLNQWRGLSLEYAAKEYFTASKMYERFKDFKKSDRLLEKIKSVLAYKNSSFNEVYYRMLIRNGRIEEASTFFGICVKENNVTPEMLTVAKDYFVKAGGVNSEFENYLKTLKSDDKIKGHKDKLLSELVNLPIESFSLESNKGSNVVLSELKGKIVVLDFWATWCEPCKNAMPGMQMAVNRFKNDDDVRFYFVDTQETIKDYKKKTQDYIKEKGFDFTLLYDNKNELTGKMDATYEKYAKAFHFSGIPQKMIIDKEGKLRWRSTGYSGSPTELADEIAIIVEYLKTEKN